MCSQGWWKLEQVVCRQESRADEKPLKFKWKGSWIIVDMVVASWLESGPVECDPTYRMFKIESKLGTCLLRTNLRGWVWELKKLAVENLDLYFSQH